MSTDKSIRMLEFLCRFYTKENEFEKADPSHRNAYYGIEPNFIEKFKDLLWNFDLTYTHDQNEWILELNDKDTNSRLLDCAMNTLIDEKYTRVKIDSGCVDIVINRSDLKTDRHLSVLNILNYCGRNDMMKDTVVRFEQINENNIVASDRCDLFQK